MQFLRQHLVFYQHQHDLVGVDWGRNVKFKWILVYSEYLELVVKPFASVMFGYSATGNQRLSFDRSHSGNQLISTISSNNQPTPQKTSRIPLEKGSQNEFNKYVALTHQLTCQDSSPHRCGKLQCSHSQSLS